MAGITGPCPSCRASIQAPPAPISFVSPFAKVPEQQYAHIASAPPSVVETQTVLPAPRPNLSEIGFRSSDDEHLVAHAAVAAANGRTSFKVEPRYIRTRNADAPDVVSRPIPDYMHGVETGPPKLPPLRNHRANPLFRLLIGTGVVLIFAGVFFALNTYIKKGTGVPKAFDASQARRIEEDPLPKESSNPIKPAGQTFTELTTPVATAGSAATPHSGAEAMKALEAFLAAPDLESRLPLIETKLGPAELAQSILAKPLPETTDITMDIQEANAAGDVNLFYNVDFRGADGKPDPQIILVRIRNGKEPRVVVDPLLDTFGGRLAEYANMPLDKPQSFQVVATAVARCYDKSVPNHQNKLTLKLMPRDNEREIANAYFSKLSKIGDMLQNDDSGFRYGQARTCRVTLQWNTTENPKMPFLEAVSLTDFRWDP